MGILGKLFGKGDAEPETSPPLATTESLVKVGPDSGKDGPGEPRLADGSPLYHALLKNPDALVVNAGETADAKNLLSQVVARNPQVVESCRDKTREAATALLRGVLDAKNTDQKAA